MRKPGYSYEAHVGVAFESETQARSFCMKQTTIGAAVAEDLKDQEVLDMFVSEDRLIVEITFPEGTDLGVQEELDAARHVGAEITIACKWVENE